MLAGAVALALALQPLLGGAAEAAASVAAAARTSAQPAAFVPAAIGAVSSPLRPSLSAPGTLLQGQVLLAPGPQVSHSPVPLPAAAALSLAAPSVKPVARAVLPAPAAAPVTAQTRFDAALPPALELQAPLNGGRESAASQLDALVLAARSDPAALSRIFDKARVADPGQAAALTDFLKDLADFRPDDAVSARLSLKGRDRVKLVFARSDGSQRLINGRFLPAYSSDGTPGTPALVLAGPVELAPAGAARQDHPGAWREYLGGGARRDWSVAAQRERRGWGPWAFDRALRSAQLVEQSWREGGWQETVRRRLESKRPEIGLSWFGRVAEKLTKIPVVGHVLTFSQKTATTIYTGLTALPLALAAAVTGSAQLELETAASVAKNPLLRLWVRDQRALDGLSPEARGLLFARVRRMRQRSLEAQGFLVVPDLAARTLNAPIRASEAAAALRSSFGAGTFGPRMIAAGTAKKGWAGRGLAAAGVLTSVLEDLGDTLCNPIMWAMLGTGQAVAALQAAKAAVWGAQAALAATQAAHYSLLALWNGPWIVSAADNLGMMAHHVGNGRTDKEFHKVMGWVASDVVYLLLLP